MIPWQEINPPHLSGLGTGAQLQSSRTAGFLAVLTWKLWKKLLKNSDIHLTSHLVRTALFFFKVTLRNGQIGAITCIWVWLEEFNRFKPLPDGILLRKIPSGNGLKWSNWGYYLHLSLTWGIQPVQAFTRWNFAKQNFQEKCERSEHAIENFAKQNLKKFSLRWHFACSQLKV